MSPARIRQLTAVGKDTYEVVFDGSVEPSTVLCTVDTSGVAPGVRVKPDPFMSGDHGDPRPIMAAVLAMHRARQFPNPAASPHPNWDIAIGLLAAVLPGSTGYSPDKIAGHTADDWQPFDLEDRDLDEVEDDLLDRCAEMTGPLIVVNDTSFASYTFRRGPYFVEAAKLREFAKSFSERVGSYLMDGHVIIVSPATGIVVMVQDDGLIATVRGRPVLQIFS